MRNENVAISFTPKGAVDFWHSEKALYQQIAAQYGLPTDETKIDANAIYQKVGATVFANIGHYVQMMDNQANTISAAYDQVPNQYSNVYGTSEVGFHREPNFNARVNNGTLLTADAYEQAIRNFAGAAKAADAQATVAKNQLAMLRAQRTGYVSTLNIQKAKLADLQKLAANRSGALATANAELITAEAALKKTKQNVVVKQAALERATAAIASKLAPKQVALEKAQKVLDSAKNKLAELKKALITAELNVAKAKDALQTSQTKLKEAQDNLEKLQNAPQALEAAQKALQAAQADYASKVKTLKDEEAKLEISRSIYTKLQENYEQLRSQLPQKAQKETDGEVQKLHLSRTYQPKPLLYYCAYFSVRAQDFDIVAMSQGKEMIKKRIKEIREKGMEASAKEQNLLTVLELANEMVERGFHFKMVDVDKSEASNFVIEGDSLIAPFRAIQGLGLNVANKIVEARQEQPFLSKKDLATRGKVSKTLIDYMTENKVLDHLPDENQLSLFDDLF